MVGSPLLIEWIDYGLFFVYYYKNLSFKIGEKNIVLKN